MKLAEIKVGDIVAVIDSPRRRGWGTQEPRKAEVVAIVEKEVRQFSSHPFAPSRMVNRKHVQVKLLDPAQSSGRYSWEKIESAKKGSTIVVETRQVAALWSEVGASIDAKREARAAADEIRKALEQRVKALGLERKGAGWVIVRADPYSDGVNVDLSVHGEKAVEKLLALAERGAAE